VDPLALYKQRLATLNVIEHYQCTHYFHSISVNIYYAVNKSSNAIYSLSLQVTQVIKELLSNGARLLKTISRTYRIVSIPHSVDIVYLDGVGAA
jgi:hypothetical protein